MIAVDTNILVHAHRGDSPWHAAAHAAIAAQAESGEPWAIPYHCLVEFVSVVTRARAFGRPSTLEEALAQVDEWLRAPALVLLTERPESWAHLRELWTADRDYSRFKRLRVRNPLQQ